MKTPHILCSDNKGKIFDVPQFTMAGMSARMIQPVNADVLMELPEGSQLFYLPGRKAVGYHKRSGKRTVIDDYHAVAAHIPPSYTQFQLAAYEMTSASPRLPLLSYTAVGWLDGKFYVPAVHIDAHTKQLPTAFNAAEVQVRVHERISGSPHNRLIAHLGLTCALKYGCANAKNLFLNRWEAPIAVTSACNANCIGCISFQPKGSVSSPQDRLPFVSTVEEIVEVAVPHLKTAEEAIVSFGQGCEGEPLLQGALIEKAVLEIRKQTSRGIVHVNTNGSRPDVVERLFHAGLDSMRVSLNSVQKELYHRYYRPNNYVFEDIVRSLRIARKLNKFSSINYFVFPGLTDSVKETEALMAFLDETQLNLIQWRNFNIDPEWYLTEICHDYYDDFIGLENLMKKIKNRFPQVAYGYVNKDAAAIADAMK
jgi:molybdenum cofactor biosynthesis enzyme MoaA